MKSKILSNLTSQARSAFAKYDTDESGVIDKDEFKAMMRDVHRQTSTGYVADVPSPRLNHYWRQLDADGSGSLEFEEFCVWFITEFLSIDTNGRF